MGAICIEKYKLNLTHLKKILMPTAYSRALWLVDLTRISFVLPLEGMSVIASVINWNSTQKW